MIRVNDTAFSITEARFSGFLNTVNPGEGFSFELLLEGEQKAVVINGESQKLKPFVNVRLARSILDWCELFDGGFSSESEMPHDFFKAWCWQQQYEDTQAYELTKVARNGAEFTFEINADTLLYFDSEPCHLHYYALTSVVFSGVCVAISGRSNDPEKAAREAIGRHMPQCFFSVSAVHKREIGSSIVLYEVEMRPEFSEP